MSHTRKAWHQASRYRQGYPSERGTDAAFSSLPEKVSDPVGNTIKLT